MKQIDTFEYISVLKDLAAQGKEVSVHISGESMVPFLLPERDTVFFKAPTFPLKKGDVVFFQRTNGRYILHRICKVENGNYFLVGDGQWEVEGPIKESQIFGVVTAVKRNGKVVTEKALSWKFYQYVWVNLIPLRSKLLRLYNLRK